MLGETLQFSSINTLADFRSRCTTLALCKKPLRYLLYTVEQVMRFVAGGREDELFVWSDAGYGGLGTKSQTGVVVAWAGAVVT